MGLFFLYFYFIFLEKAVQNNSFSQDSSVYLVVCAFEVLLPVGLQKWACASLLPQNHPVYPTPSLENSSAKLSYCGWLPSFLCGRELESSRAQMLHHEHDGFFKGDQNKLLKMTLSESSLCLIQEPGLFCIMPSWWEEADCSLQKPKWALGVVMVGGTPVISSPYVPGQLQSVRFLEKEDFIMLTFYFLKRDVWMSMLMYPDQDRRTWLLFWVG